MSVVMTTLGNWERGLAIPLQDAIRMSMVQMGRTAEQATRGLVGFMASSAGKLTKVAKRTRPVSDNPKFEHLLKSEQYKTAARPERHFRYFAVKRIQDKGRGSRRILFANLPEDKKKIGKVSRAGLAKRSWKLSTFAGDRGYPKSGVSGKVEQSGTFATLANVTDRSKTTVGHELTNNLVYIQKAMPSGWQSSVQRSAINRLMGTIRNRLAMEFQSSMNRASARGAAGAASALRGALR